MSDNTEVLNHMFKPTLTTPTDKDEIICIVDRSGSMQRIRDDAEGGLNAFIEEQAKIAGGANLTLVEFDNHVDTIYDRVDITRVEPYKLQPRNMTALFDAIGMTLNGFPDTRGKKVVVIVTDGDENASHEYTRDQIFNLITEKKELGWEFVFLAANQDAIKAGGSIGIDASNTINFAATGDGAHDGYAAATVYATSFRSMSKEQALADLADAKLKSANIS